MAEKKQAHCLQCGNPLVSADPKSKTMKFCNKCGFDLTSIAKKKHPVKEKHG